MADHRAEQVLAAVKTTLEADGTFSVFRTSVDALSEALQQVPSAVIFQGDDDPRGDSGFEVLGSFNSVLTVHVDLWDAASGNESVETQLNELRKKVHIALMGSTRLGLSFVFNLAPAGAEEPEISEDGQALSGKLRTNWMVEYRTSVTDPSA